MKRPNILVFFTDQQRWDTCGCYGQALSTTPHLDRMAEEGTSFSRAFTCQPVCGPARAALRRDLWTWLAKRMTAHGNLLPCLEPQ